MSRPTTADPHNTLKPAGVTSIAEPGSVMHPGFTPQTTLRATAESIPYERLAPDGLSYLPTTYIPAGVPPRVGLYSPSPYQQPMMGTQPASRPHLGSQLGKVRGHVQVGLHGT